MPRTLRESQNVLPPHRRIALLTDGYSTPFLAKTAINLLRYRTADIAAVIETKVAAKTAQEVFQTGGNVPIVSGIDDVPGVDAVYVGIAPPGGKLPAEWRPTILTALRKGIDVVSGLHDFLVDDPEYVAAASASGSKLIDVRKNWFKDTGHGLSFREGCLRVHAVGHDCSIGKMVASVEIELGLKRLGERAKFLATGQTGIMISGEGVPIDCVVSDFVNGAAEMLVKENEEYDYLLVEGQGSLSHPAYSAVTMGLLHGCAPQALVFCYEAGRVNVKGFDHIQIPSIERLLEYYTIAANFREPCKFVGMAVNTRTLTAEAAKREVAEAEQRYGLPACDVYRDGADKLVQAVMLRRKEVFGS